MLLLLLENFLGEGVHGLRAFGANDCSLSGLDLGVLDELADIDLSLLHDLDLGDDAESDWEGLGSLGDDVVGEVLAQHVVGEVIDGVLGSALGQDLDDLLSDSLDLRRLGIGVDLSLVAVSVGAEENVNSEDVVVAGLNIGENVNEGLSLSQLGNDSLSGAGHASERGVEVLSFDLLNLHLNLSPSHWGVFLDVSVVDFAHSADDSLLSSLLTNWDVAWNPSDWLRSSERWGADNLVPLLLGEWVLVGLLDGLATLLQSFVLSDRHSTQYLILI